MSAMSTMVENFLRRPQGPAEVAADAVRLLGLVGVIVAALWFTWTDVGILALILPALLIPRFAGVRPWFDIILNVTVLLAAWSNVIDLYRTVPWWDVIFHFVCTGVLALMAYVLLVTFGFVAPPSARRSPSAGAVVLSTIIGLALSAVWEMIEWLGLTFITDDIFVTYVDTIGDMAVGGSGALLAGFAAGHVSLPARSGARSPVAPGRNVGRPLSR